MKHELIIPVARDGAAVAVCECSAQLCFIYPPPPGDAGGDWWVSPGGLRHGTERLHHGAVVQCRDCGRTWTLPPRELTAAFLEALASGIRLDRFTWKAGDLVPVP